VSKKRDPHPPRRWFVIPDIQAKPGVPLDHCTWAGRACVKYKPDVIVQLGDVWDMPSLNSHVDSGSLEAEGRRVRDDIEAGNEAFRLLNAPIDAEIARTAKGKGERWKPRRVFLMGNHEDRITRAINADPKLAGIIGLDMLQTPGWERHPFLEIVTLDGIAISHFFQSSHSHRPIGGSIDSRLNRIGTSFIAGHEQGFIYSCKPYPGGMIRHGLVAGSYYLHDEKYRGPQSNGEFRGCFVLNEVRNGTYDLMVLSIDYMRRAFSDASRRTKRRVS
jgi:hypothetical protein